MRHFKVFIEGLLIPVSLWLEYMWEVHESKKLFCFISSQREIFKFSNVYIYKILGNFYLVTIWENTSIEMMSLKGNTGPFHIKVFCESTTELHFLTLHVTSRRRSRVRSEFLSGSTYTVNEPHWETLYTLLRHWRAFQDIPLRENSRAPCNNGSIFTELSWRA